MNRIRGAKILLKSGRYFDFEDIWRSPWTLDDLMWSVAHQCRYTGHVKKYYSVAEHLVHCSKLDKGIALPLLMHDIHEGITGDMSGPLKSIMPEYKALEKEVEEAVLTKLQVPRPHGDKIKFYDLQMRRLEQAVVCGNSDDWGNLNIPFPDKITIKFWSQEQAYEELKCRYREVVPISRRPLC